LVAYLQEEYTLDTGRLKDRILMVLVSQRRVHDEDTGDNSEHMEESEVKIQTYEHRRNPFIGDGCMYVFLYSFLLQKSAYINLY
jgi:TPP-dependent indolepyruvate ferredoxin oxidoreductase alpha subunit